MQVQLDRQAPRDPTVLARLDLKGKGELLGTLDLREPRGQPELMELLVLREHRERMEHRVLLDLKAHLGQRPEPSSVPTPVAAYLVAFPHNLTYRGVVRFPK